MDKILPATLYVKKLKGTAQEVWSRLLLSVHGAEKHTAAEWQALIDQHAAAPAQQAR